VGGDSKIGRALADSLRRQGAAVLCTSRRPHFLEPDWLPLDLADPHLAILPRVTSAVLCASVTSTERCRLEPAQSRQINVLGQVRVAKHLTDRGAFVIFLSTNQVFDGEIPHRRENDAPCPTTEYGKQKAAAEEALLALGPRVAILRLSKVLEPGFGLFEQWRDRLRQGQAIEPFADVHIAPIALQSVLSALAMLIGRQQGGVFHLSGERDVSYADVGRLLAKRLGVSAELVLPISGRASGRVAAGTPRHTTLDMTRLCNEYGMQPPGVTWTIESELARHAA
jgi:dTDP-4-dehydrorhamnose reductase